MDMWQKKTEDTVVVVVVVVSVADVVERSVSGRAQN